MGEEEEYIPVECKKCGKMIEHEDDLVVMIWPDGHDTYFHDTCAYIIIRFCKDAQQGKRVRGW